MTSLMPICPIGATVLRCMRRFIRPRQRAIAANSLDATLRRAYLKCRVNRGHEGAQRADPGGDDPQVHGAVPAGGARERIGHQKGPGRLREGRQGLAGGDRAAGERVARQRAGRDRRQADASGYARASRARRARRFSRELAPVEARNVCSDHASVVDWEAQFRRLDETNRDLTRRRRLRDEALREFEDDISTDYGNDLLARLVMGEAKQE
eukprot:scaffold141418_cov38-Prasinocladus_malaysianus.AAC.1